MSDSNAENEKATCRSNSKNFSIVTPQLRKLDMMLGIVECQLLDNTLIK